MEKMMSFFFMFVLLLNLIACSDTPVKKPDVNDNAHVVVFNDVTPSGDYREDELFSSIMSNADKARELYLKMEEKTLSRQSLNCMRKELSIYQAEDHDVDIDVLKTVAEKCRVEQPEFLTTWYQILSDFTRLNEKYQHERLYKSLWYEIMNTIFLPPVSPG